VRNMEHLRKSNTRKGGALRFGFEFKKGKKKSIRIDDVNMHSQRQDRISGAKGRGRQRTGGNQRRNIFQSTQKQTDAENAGKMKQKTKRNTEKVFCFFFSVLVLLLVFNFV